MTAKQVFTFIFLAAIVSSTLLMANKLIKEHQSVSTSASAGSAQIFFEPSVVNLQNSGTLNLWATIDKPLAFVRVSLAFDKTKLKLSQEITAKNSNLTQIIKATKAVEANTTGQIVVVIALPPSSYEVSVIGTVPIATLNFIPINTANMSTNISVNVADSQLVDISATPYALTGQGSTITYGSIASPSPSPSPTGDTLAPLVRIISPADGSVIRGKTRVTISASATDNTKVAKVIISNGNSVICTDYSAPYSCSWTAKGSIGTRYTITARAYDLSGNNSTHSITLIQN